MSKRPTIKRLREVFSYDPTTGVISWKVYSGRRAKPGKEAGGYHNQGYRQLCVDKCLMLSHRVAWALYYGEWPDDGMVIDHINNIRNDNRICNLRVVTETGNHLNRLPYKSNNENQGTYKRGNSFAAKIVIDGKQKHLGTFPTREQARDAYKTAKEKYWNSD